MIITLTVHEGRQIGVLDAQPKVNEITLDAVSVSDHHLDHKI